MTRQSASNSNTSDRQATLAAVIPTDFAGLRADQALAKLFPDYSRSRLQQWIRSGNITLDSKPFRARARVHGGERVELLAALNDQTIWRPEPLALGVVYEDDELIVVNKPAGMVVHPGAGNPDGTLVNALLHHDAGLAAVPRAGLIHRIDKDTTGLLLVARTLRSHGRLVTQLASRGIHREYDAIVVGYPSAGGRLDAPIGRHRVHRTRMAVVKTGKSAVTHYRVLRRFAEHSHVRIALETGRTHQIRVHMAALGHPLVGDPVYGGRRRIPKGASPRLVTALRGFKRQALHAARLSFQHPEDGADMNLEAPMPQDMLTLLKIFREEAGA